MGTKLLVVDENHVSVDGKVYNIHVGRGHTNKTLTVTELLGSEWMMCNQKKLFRPLGGDSEIFQSELNKQISAGGKEYFFDTRALNRNFRKTGVDPAGTYSKQLKEIDYIIYPFNVRTKSGQTAFNEDTNLRRRRNFHWAFVVVCVKDKRIEFYDSLFKMKNDTMLSLNQVTCNGLGIPYSKWEWVDMGSSRLIPNSPLNASKILGKKLTPGPSDATVEAWVKNESSTDKRKVMYSMQQQADAYNCGGFHVDGNNVHGSPHTNGFFNQK